MPQTDLKRPAIDKVLATLAKQDLPKNVEIHRLEVRVLANGQCMCRMFPTSGDDYHSAVFFAE